MPTPLVKEVLDTPTLKRQTQGLYSEKRPQETKCAKVKGSVWQTGPTMWRADFPVSGLSRGSLYCFSTWLCSGSQVRPTRMT